VLAERYHLATHHESREMRIYDLTVAKDGPKFKQSRSQPATADGLQPPPTHAVPPTASYHGPLFLNLPAISMPRLAEYLSGFLGAPINDATSLQGDYEIHLRTVFAGTSPEPTADGASLTVFDALPEQLGLRLVSKKAQVDVLVVDRMEKSPTEN